MARNSDKLSTFAMLAGALGVLLLILAGFIYLQAGSSGAGGGANAPLAAVSQAIPLHARAALAGDSDGFRDLRTDLESLARLRRGANLPGEASAWDGLERNARALLDRESDIAAVTSAGPVVEERIPVLIEGIDRLLGQSGATDALLDAQRRAVSLRAAVNGLAGAAVAGRAGPVAEAIAGDLGFLRAVVDALGGQSTSLDIAALDDAAALAPVADALAAVESAVGPAVAAVGRVADVGSVQTQLSAAAATIRTSAFVSAGADSNGGMLSSPYIPLGLVAAALALLAGLAILHARAAVFEKASREQAEQNDRNQQAILRLLDELGSLADGDLTVEATVTEDITGAIADSINYAIEKLRELVATINQTAIMVDSAAKQTENTAVHMARAAETQAREISAATESIVSMAASIEEVSGNAERSSDVARHSVEVAHKGGDAVRRTIDGMNAIRETIQDTSKRIKRLGESSQEIGNIVELINDIAEQTNILALYASIQASMAGEAGRGFAVVADEVQRLAERSTNATKQIEVLVRTIQSDTNEAVVSMERSTTDVVGGALLAENAGAALDEIEQVSNQIASLVQNISGSAREQAGSAADVTRRTTKLKEISDQTGKATTATAASISKLSELASQLRKTVAGFTLPNSASQTVALSAGHGSAAPRAAHTSNEKAASRG